MPRQDLPIYALARELIGAVRNGGRRLILRAPTGSGKSTQVPQILLAADLVPSDRQIVVLQPRRLAARLLAARVAATRWKADWAVFKALSISTMICCSRRLTVSTDRSTRALLER